MRVPQRLSLALPLLLALLAGCGTRSTLSEPEAPAANGGPDQAEVASEMGRNPEFVDEDVALGPEQTALAEAGPGEAGALAAIRPLFFWRDIRHIERRFEFAFADTDTTGRPTTAVVTVHKHLAGSFHIVVGDSVPEGSPPEAHVLRKPLHDHWVRRVLLKRVPMPGSDRTVWRIAATSGVRITAREAATRIVSLRVQSGALDTTITEPLAFFRLRALLRLEPGAEVVLTATTLRADDIVLLYRRDHRSRFANHGDGTHTARFRAGDLGGIRHLGVNALAHATLFDDAAPYDSQSWIVPFLVRPLVLADGTP